MTVLENLISQMTDISDPNAVLSALTDKTIVTVNDVEYSIAGVQAFFGPEPDFVIGIMTGMTNAINYFNSNNQASTAQYLQVYYDRFTIGSGLNFSHDQVRAELDALVPFLGQDTVDKLKSLGITNSSLWETNSSDPDPSLDDVTAAIATIQTNRNLITWVSYVKNGILANNGNGKTIDELKLLISEV